ncbi:glycosyltransferase family 4 protein [Proteus terrae]|uniref:glycosyltransferase family 4 protein n=1 Tax=Proteus terrae TaxID=1574161 RepID=UPI00232DE92C|nr:glycosyltransferase family 4 protein [Proteus terrae]WCG90523.1 glycosyltransferase family 4 protein [Proteus terrae]
MNILFICNEYPPFISGGIGIFTKDLSIKLSEKGNNIIIIGTYPIEEDQIEIKIAEKIKLIKIKKHNGIVGEILNRINIYKKIKYIINNSHIDILEVQDFNGPLAFYPKLPVTTISRLHGTVSYFNKLSDSLSITNSLKNIIWKFIEKSSLKKSDKIISVSHFTAIETKKIFNIKNNIDVIHNGIPLVQDYKEKSSFNNPINFVFAGSIIRKKGILELINAWIKLNKTNHNINLNIYGKDTEGLVSMLKNILICNECKSVYFHSPVQKSKLLEIYNDADFCIFPSKAEAFSLAPMEAMSMSKVTLYTNQTSASELINEHNGIIIEECTSDYIYQSLMHCLSLSTSDYNRISLNAYKTINNKFNINKIIEKNIQFYEKSK